MSLLEIDNLSLSIQDTHVLNNVSLHVDAGEILAITGESGSGKSMTAFATMQLLPPGARTTGRILLQGRDVTALSDSHLCALRGAEVGMVFQEPMTALNPVHRIGAQVAETIRIHKSVSAAKAADQAETALKRAGLPPDRFSPQRYPHELSGGQRQRVVIAIAIALGPKLLIADEPTTALDVTTQAQILDLLVGLAREDRMGLVLITHDLAVVAEHADRICVMRRGQVVETGPTAQLLRTRKHPYTRKLFAASSHKVELPPAPAPDPLLVVESIRRSFRLPRKHLFDAQRRFEAVRGVSFTLHRGERLGLVGESGCGKSTLTRALLGLAPLQGGQVLLNGVPLFQHGRATEDARRKIQVVFQDPFGSFNPRHRVARLISEPFHVMSDAPKGADRTAAVGAALLAVGLQPEAAERYIHEFSGGQRQRIAIARALITRPDIVLLDEAVSALDVSVRAQILDLLADLCASHGLTYLFISHDLSVVRSVTDRVLVMQAGEIVERGETETVFTNPQHSYTKTLLDAAPRLPKFAEQDSAG
ncbi:MAG: dipeptide ABC transporter ATP-binding protein [Pseudomonadota bacterium]